jgi:hypothetical protein
MLVFMCGAISYSSIFANVSMLLQNVDENGHRYRSKMSTMNKLLRFCKVPMELETRIRGNMLYNWSVTGGFDFHEVRACCVELRQEITRPSCSVPWIESWCW